MVYKNLKKFQDQRDTCKYKEDNISKGLWCNKNNSKCCYNNCFKHPLISDGTKNIKNGGVIKKGVDKVDKITEREIEAFKYYNKETPKLTFTEIGDRMGVSRQRANFLVNTALKKLGITGKKRVNSKVIPLTNDKGLKRVNKRHKIEFHAEEIVFDIEPINILVAKTVKWSNTEYLSIDNETHHLKIFYNKIKVNFKKAIEGYDKDEVQLEIDKRCANFLRNINFYLKRELKKKDIKLKVKIKIVKDKYTRVKRHWAIIGTAIAKKLKDTKEKMYLYDWEDNTLLLLFDLSEPCGHLETHNMKKGDKVIDKMKNFVDIVIQGDVDMPNVTKEKLDFLQKDYVRSVEKQTEANIWMAENQKSHDKVLKGILNAVKSLKDEVKKLNGK